jgi:pyridoxamine 5'-phosphate oxidase
VSEPFPDHYDDLDAVRRTAWSMLDAGARDRRTAAHTPALATVGPDGAPHVRTVVLRRFLADERMLVVHTDRRSAKVGDLAAEPRCAVLVYDREAKIQLRLGGTARVETQGALVETAWAATRDFSRECYRVTGASGAPIDAPQDAVFSAEATNDGGDNFAVITIAVDSLEWLYLHNAGHRRARFDTSADGAWAGQWLIP